MPHAIDKYRRKISGPVADRIDMWVHVGEMPPETLSLRLMRGKDDTDMVKGRIASARTRQFERFKELHDISTNADMGPKEIETLAQLRHAR
jgi:magnesium chelatase family protein